VPSDAFVFGAVGRLAPVKGYDIALDTFRELMSAHRERNLWLVLVGDGPSRRELQDRALELGIGDRVCFPGFTDRPWESYAALDVFLMPSVTEGLPHSLLEAMASLCVPIAMAVAAIPEVLNKKGLGWLVTPGDRKAFGDAMRDAACAGSAKLAEIGRLGRQRIEQHFNSKIQLMRLADLIERESFRNVAVSFQNPRSSTPTPSPTGL
jgi:glycosyltransferase involved in cell wall biosynthesis